MLYITLFIISVFLYIGCADVASLAKDLNDRKVQSCIYANGSYGPFIGIHTITATGGMTVKECMKYQ